MKTKFRPYLYLCGAVVLASAMLWLDRPEPSASRPLFASFDPQQVASLEIEHLMDGVRLIRVDNTWQVEAIETPLTAQMKDQAQEAGAAEPKKFPADAERIAQVLKTVAELAVGSPASRKAERHDQLQVGTLALQVRASNGAGESLATLYIGKAGPDYFSTYLRRAGDDAVYLVADQLQGRFPARLDAWQDKTVWTLSPDDITAVAVDRLDGGFRLEKNAEGMLVLTSPKAATNLTTEKLTSWLARITTLRSVEFPTVDLQKAGLVNPAYTLSITLTDGSRQTLSLGNDNPSGNPYALQSGNPLPLLLPTDVREALKVDWEGWITATIRSARQKPDPR